MLTLPPPDGCVDEIPASDVNANMIDGAAAGTEENQVAGAHFFKTDGAAGLALFGGGAGQGDALCHFCKHIGLGRCNQNLHRGCSPPNL